MRIFFFLTGFVFLVIGLSTIILYLNLLTIGYNFQEYVNFISRRIECYLPPIGLIIMYLTINIKGAKKYELYL